jgi:hypothetical protein
LLLTWMIDGDARTHINQNAPFHHRRERRRGERPPTRRNGVRAERVSTAAETKINVGMDARGSLGMLDLLRAERIEVPATTQSPEAQTV